MCPQQETLEYLSVAGDDIKSHCRSTAETSALKIKFVKHVNDLGTGLEPQTELQDFYFVIQAGLGENFEH